MDMKPPEPERKQELIIYGILWGAVLFIVPVVLLIRGMSDGAPFRIKEVLDIWLGVLPFFVLFVLHSLLAAPLWVEKGKTGVYACVFILLAVLFGLYVRTTRVDPGPIDHHRPPPMESRDAGNYHPRPIEEENRPPRDLGRPMTPEVMKFLLGLLLMGVNLGVKFYLKSARSERKMQELKAENLVRQLETLRYQINPHFFMNTLNNIHALVDIDSEQAKASIEKFSKLMRFILYEGDRQTIPLTKELEFIQHYVALMKMRYEDSVRIDLSFPEEVPGAAEVPPLVLASFVENAFKHGISYEKPSFVQVTITLLENRISFRCVNSCQGDEQALSHGVGLTNVRGRLDLLYGSNYTLQINQSDEVYDISLLLPARPEKEVV